MVVVSQALALPGFEDVAVATGLTQPTVVKFAANGKMFVGQKDGRIFVYDSVDDTSATLFADLRTQVMNFWDRGLLGLAVDPNYPATPHVFVLYTWDVDSLSGTAPRWNDACADATGNGCVVYARLSRLTDMGSSGPTTSSEQVLLAGWGNQFPSHTIGSLNFGPDGALYLSSGEGANFNAEDWGQWGGNPLGDPPGGSMSPPSARGGALRSQSLRRPAGDPILLNGTILRVDKTNGAHLPDNPLASNPNANAKRIIASGLRNPFRFTIHPTTGELWVGDVGWGTWEEINRLARAAPVENFGWPCWEGSPRQGGYDSANLTICEDLYNTSLHVAPHYAYNHANQVVPGETCTTGSSSITGLAIYNTGSYPTDYQGALFFADYTRRCIWVMRDHQRRAGSGEDLELRHLGRQPGRPADRPGRGPLLRRPRRRGRPPRAIPGAERRRHRKPDLRPDAADGQLQRHVIDPWQRRLAELRLGSGRRRRLRRRHRLDRDVHLQRPGDLSGPPARHRDRWRSRYQRSDHHHGGRRPGPTTRRCRSSTRRPAAPPGSWAPTSRSRDTPRTPRTAISRRPG